MSNAILWDPQNSMDFNTYQLSKTLLMEVLFKMNSADVAALSPWRSGAVQGLSNPCSPFLQVIKDMSYSRHPSILSLTLVGTNQFTATYWKSEYTTLQYFWGEWFPMQAPGTGTICAQHGKLYSTSQLMVRQVDRQRPSRFQVWEGDLSMYLVMEKSISGKGRDTGFLQPWGDKQA